MLPTTAARGVLRGAVRLASLGLALASLGCAGGVRVEVAPGHDFRGYRTWDWLALGWEQTAPRNEADRRLQASVRAELERALAARGLDRADGERPDFYLACHVESSREIQVYYETKAVETLSSMHDSPSYEVTASEQRYRVYEEATVVVDVAEPVDRQLVWRGTRTRRVRGRFAPHVPEVVEQILERFPPPAGTGSDTP